MYILIIHKSKYYLITLERALILALRISWENANAVDCSHSNYIRNHM